ncbi:MAG: hypothetical protein ACFFE8_01060 [Candidatus Heimdallarchaeota archaeon]
MAIDSRDELGNQLHEDNDTRITHLPKSAREVYQLLKLNGALKPQEIGNHTTLSNRTIRYALKILIEDALVRRVPDLRDLRSHYYALN